MANPGTGAGEALKGFLQAAGSFLDTILHFCYKKTQEGFKNMILFNMALAGHQAGFRVREGR